MAYRNDRADRWSMTCKDNMSRSMSVCEGGIEEEEKYKI